MEYLSHNLWLVWTSVMFICLILDQHSCGIGRSTFLGAGSGLGYLLYA